MSIFRWNTRFCRFCAYCFAKLLELCFHICKLCARLQIWFAIFANMISTMQAELHDSQPRRDNVQNRCSTYCTTLCASLQTWFCIVFCKHGLQVLPNSSTVSQIWTTKAWSAHLRTWWETIASLFCCCSVCKHSLHICMFCTIRKFSVRHCRTCWANLHNVFFKSCASNLHHVYTTVAWLWLISCNTESLHNAFFL